MPGVTAELQIKVISDEVKRANSRLDILEKRAKKAQTATSKLSKSFDNAARSLKRLVLGYIGFTAALSATKAIVRADQALAKITNRLIFVTGSAEAARKEFQRLSQRADFFGQDIRTLAQQYTLLAAATKGSKLEGAETRLIFEAVSSAAATLALSTEDVEGAFRALRQMVSKGKISMEELSEQLGERLPGAMDMAARSAGKTKAEFIKIVSTGKLITEDFLPAFTREMLKAFGGDIERKTNTTTGAINRFNNALFSLSTSGAEDFMETFRDTLGDITETLKDENFKAGVGFLLDIVAAMGSATAKPFTEGAAALGSFVTMAKVALGLFPDEESPFSGAVVGVKSTALAPRPDISNRKSSLVAAKRLAVLEESLMSETELLKSNLNNQILIVEDAENRKIIARQEANAIIMSLESKQAAELERIDKKRQDMKLNKASEFFSNFSALVFSENKKLARIGQAAAIAEATISTFVAANKALSAFPPPFNVIAMAGALATGFANVQAIKSQGFAHGGFVGGRSFGGDNVQANVNSGEAILNAAQQRNFMRLANGAGGKTELKVVINNLPGQSARVERDSNGDVTIRIVQAAVSEVAQQLNSGDGPVARGFNLANRRMRGAF